MAAKKKTAPTVEAETPKKPNRGPTQVFKESKPDKLREWEFKGQPIRVAMSRRKNESPKAFKERFEVELARKRKACPPDESGG